MCGPKAKGDWLPLIRGINKYTAFLENGFKIAGGVPTSHMSLETTRNILRSSIYALDNGHFPWKEWAGGC